MLKPTTSRMSRASKLTGRSVVMADLGIPLAKLLHGEQGFSYHRAACAGDTVTVRSTITDIYDKKNGALEFVVKTSRATNQRNELVAELRTVIVCRN